jgi:thymidine kinase
MKNEFVMFVGPMFGGKTTKLLSAIDRYKYQGKKIAAFKPCVDERYSKEEIVTHWGGRLEATRVENGEALLAWFDFEGINPRQEKLVVAVDEAFMIEGVGEILVEMFKDGHTILVSSLQLSSDFTPYEEMKVMMPFATKIEVCPAVCNKCGADAHYTEKIGGRSDHGIEVGGSEMYHPRCFYHFKQHQSKQI